MTSTNTVYQEISNTVALLEEMATSVPDERKEVLKRISEAVKEDKKKYGAAQLVFICTHNSRRSQMAQIWMSFFADQFGLALTAFSGGTEVTAFNPNAIKAMESMGFQTKSDGDSNPRIEVSWKEDESVTCFSKEFDHSENPMEKFNAVMTCSQANEACPVIPGARKRIPLEYDDPKESDGSGNEDRVYRERALEIGTEIMLLAKFSKRR
jgi:protein-tyrosine-phosphatase